MVFGPNMQNFADIVGSFLSKEGAVQVPDASGLEAAIADLLADPAKRERLGRNAQAVVQENLGAVGRTVEMIVEHLEGGKLYVAPRRQPAA
jgi:3-deoxy-D-manno-octulosonic-acid transferase